MSTSSTNIRVFVKWKEQTVFAGEDIECEITFKNIATTPAPSKTSLHPPANGFATGGDRQRKIPTGKIKNSSPLSPRPAQSGRGHRGTFSSSTQAGSVRQASAISSWNGEVQNVTKEKGSHKRSVSIVSIGASEATVEDSASIGMPERPHIGSRHGRSASMQVVPRRNGSSSGPPSATINPRSPVQPSPLVSSFSHNGPETILPERPSRRQTGITTAPSTPGISGARRKTSNTLQNFKFPITEPSSSESQSMDPFEDPRPTQDQAGLLSPRPRDVVPQLSDKFSAPARVISPASIAGTPRSSGEFYSLSNNSNETLASEYLPQQPGRMRFNGGHSRKPSNMTPANNHRVPETLMMGYAQISGAFTLDASLINQAPFEEVKRKGAVGGQGGGVIGIESNKRDSGLLRNFGWGNIGESLGGFLGGGELSSIKDMRGVASSRSVPILSTPQSILFVDLRLAPGDSRSYNYSFKLPRGLPPTHRGKVIKIAYKLVIGTQRPGGAKEQQVKSVELPFRILGSVNTHGELLGHDLMSPYIILRDQARVKSADSQTDAHSTTKEKKSMTSLKTTDSTSEDFLSYVEELLTRPRQNSSLGLLSPTEIPRSRRQSSIDEPATAKEAIDMAILRSNVATESQQSANKFEIARSGKRVAVIMLARPAYRLGETITVAIDFADAEIPCYAIHATLETSERVDNSIALRSEASILRVTRKIHVSHSESTLFARRIVFSPTIPISATPEFITSGVSLDWRVRIEFVTPRLVGDYGEQDYAELLEEISSDDRGMVLAAAEVLDCESFEIAVPLRVYGALGGNTEREENLLEGLAV